MSIIGNGWKDEPTPQETYQEITGEEFNGDERELRKRIEKKLEDAYTSRTERNRLQGLLNDEKL